MIVYLSFNPSRECALEFVVARVAQRGGVAENLNSDVHLVKHR